MPRNSINGSVFPGLEQERQSIPHTDRAARVEKNKDQTTKLDENKRKTEESVKRTS